ncbi:hypothetical protein HHK36_006932 [Tetracentron sinense]|uniref:Uncharacterized protein n=1 Tax=Tetracentron sinense TaxID=13715 RepID=A0A834ZQM4_TETSI|nr:hypothetical protein HHK36_006932 [Tetracentron sinense]
MFTLRTATEKIKVAILEESLAAESRPWNLRTRSAFCKAPNEIEGRGASMNEKKKQNSSSLRFENQANKSLRLRGLAASQGVEKKDPCKFSISLSREEIEEDFILMVGTKPSRRPKKRAKIVQKHMDYIFPGLWLSGVSPDSYKVPDFPESGKLNYLDDCVPAVIEATKFLDVSKSLLVDD